VSSADTHDNQDQDGEPEDAWSSFKKLCDEAANVADQIVKRLGSLKLKDGKYRKFRSLQVAVESLWSGSEIAALLKRLSGLKEALGTRVLFSIRSINSRRVE
jgi:hypothetical protein